jgi:hypothetical protein
MSNHPINLALRFLLEIAALVIMGLWGYQLSAGPLRVAFAIGIPLLAAALWGIFRFPGDPRPDVPVPVPGAVRLLLEVLYFGFAAWALSDMGMTQWALIFAGVVVLHYAVSLGRIRWMLGGSEP